MIPNTAILPQGSNVQVEASLSKTVAKVVIILAVAGGIYFIYRKFRGGILQLFGKISEGDVVREAKSTINTSNLSYEKIWFESAADSLFTSMQGSGTSEKQLYNIFSQLNNLDDLKQLIASFGTRTGRPAAFSKTVTGNLSTWLSVELSAREIQKINTLLTDKKIQFSF